MAKRGRPTVMTDDVIARLREGFAMSFTDDEACLYVGISRSALFDYCLENPAFAEEREILKRKPNMQAKMNLVSGIKKQDMDDSKWWLERKGKDEFSTKHNVDQNNSGIQEFVITVKP